MREIKFRAWQKYHKRMVKVVNINFRFERITADYGEDTAPRYNTYDFSCFEVMQYTGLKDKNDKEIYEGDIIDFTYWWFDGNVAESHLIGEVVYLPEYMSYGLRGVKNADWIRHIGGDEGSTDTAPFATWTFDEADFEVIGNIFENPELLKGDTP